MGRSTFSGPVRSNAGFEASADSQALTKYLQGTAEVTVAAIAADAEATVTITVTGAAVGDFAMVSAPAAAQEDGLVIAAVWVSAADTVSIKLRNADASVANLTGSTEDWTYLVTSIA